MKKNIKTYLLIISMALVASCKTDSPKPDLQNDVKVVQAVMIDLYVAEQALKNINEEFKDSLRTLYISQIEAIHDIDMDIVESDIDLIKNNPEWYLEIHKVVKDSIITLESNSKKKTPSKQQKKIEEEIKKAAEESKKK